MLSVAFSRSCAGVVRSDVDIAKNRVREQDEASSWSNRLSNRTGFVLDLDPYSTGRGYDEAMPVSFELRVGPTRLDEVALRYPDEVGSR